MGESKLMVAEAHVKKLDLRDVAMKVKVEEKFTFDYIAPMYSCPVCDGILGGIEKFCPHCGQRLKW